MENEQINSRGRKLFELWHQQTETMAVEWKQLSPKERLMWVGPDMSARSMITARQMETWAHGQEVFDLFGQEQPQSDRIYNIIVLGVNTFGWSHTVNDLNVPNEVPELHLTAPSGKIWSLGTPGSDNMISGNAIEFAQVVTQTRNVADTSLSVTGSIANKWMRIAQCFAGARETPPAKGKRYRIISNETA